jgi:hypothetical protein
MKPDTQDFERGLERRLWLCAVDHSPAAPRALYDFIETVPEMPRRSTWSGRTVGLPGLRRGALAVAVTAALVAAVVLSSVVLNVRQTQTSGPGSGGWIWQRADGSVVGGTSQVARGFIGSCNPNHFGDGTLCSSPDGLHWSTPADPSIVKVEGGGAFEPINVVRFGREWLALGAPAEVNLASPSFPAPTDSVGNGMTLWRSTDGVDWVQVDQAPFAGLSLTNIGALRNGFIVVAASTPDDPGWTLTSPDGATWTRSSHLPATPGFSAADSTGLYIGQRSPSPGEWRTGDGTNWTPLTLPAGIEFVSQVHGVPGGGFVAAGLGSSAQETLLRSADGIRWEAGTGTLNGTLFGISVIGDRIVASTIPGSMADLKPSDLRLWQSEDWGLTWQPLVGPDGIQMSGLSLPMGDGLAIKVADPQSASRLTWVGTLRAP